MAKMENPFYRAPSKLLSGTSELLATSGCQSTKRRKQIILLCMSKNVNSFFKLAIFRFMQKSSQLHYWKREGGGVMSRTSYRNYCRLVTCFPTINDKIKYIQYSNQIYIQLILIHQTNIKYFLTIVLFLEPYMHSYQLGQIY